ncbi:hypothetical protein DL89DRAFT_259680 [Linderina pennispora]|uniref:Uncharacterized protein n=1 Tax=Linderina pennispora TaxID=61395 RepID=A0A1Y1W0U5_9FUNG|nr:uncharacterized protein DL89DRAFT_259680 [Linderina pennispora]ORX67159.1 hypothetical protein DL89DRAFT_259680 [Linderina pennispora]
MGPSLRLPGNRLYHFTPERADEALSATRRLPLVADAAHGYERIHTDAFLNRLGFYEGLQPFLAQHADTFRRATDLLLSPRFFPNNWGHYNHRRGHPRGSEADVAACLLRYLQLLNGEADPSMTDELERRARPVLREMERIMEDQQFVIADHQDVAVAGGNLRPDLVIFHSPPPGIARINGFRGWPSIRLIAEVKATPRYFTKTNMLDTHSAGFGQLCDYGFFIPALGDWFHADTDKITATMGIISYLLSRNARRFGYFTDYDNETIGFRFDNPSTAGTTRWTPAPRYHTFDKLLSCHMDNPLSVSSDPPAILRIIVECCNTGFHIPSQGSAELPPNIDILQLIFDGTSIRRLRHLFAQDAIVEQVAVLPAGDDDGPGSQSHFASDDDGQAAAPATPTQTRSGRVSRPPNRLTYEYDGGSTSYSRRTWILSFYYCCTAKVTPDHILCHPIMCVDFKNTEEKREDEAVSAHHMLGMGLP